MITHKDINGALQTHKAWIDNPRGGKPADLRGAQLRNVNLEGADFRWADCRAADFSGANLSKTDFRHADLRGANFTGAICIGASFVNARMDGVNMTGVDLRGAVMDYAQMTGMNLNELRETAKAASRNVAQKDDRGKDRGIDRDR
jgi:uncharacterized protein YjbI with pentapeptide repeats